MKGHNPDMSGLKEGKATKNCMADSYVSQPKGAYGKKSGLQPHKARTRGYTPDSSDENKKR